MHKYNYENEVSLFMVQDYWQDFGAALKFVKKNLVTVIKVVNLKKIAISEKTAMH